MKKIIIKYFLLLCLIIQASCAISSPIISKKALAKQGLSMNDARNISTFYYRNPQPDKLIALLKAILSQKELITDKSHFDVFAHLLATVACNDTTFFDKINHLQNMYTGLQKEALQEIIYQAKNFKSPPPSSPKYLDYLWAEFNVTGNEMPVKKIISVLNFPNENINDLLLIKAAEWSLKSNAKQHKKVYDIIKSESYSASGILQKKLLKILEN